METKHWLMLGGVAIAALILYNKLSATGKLLTSAGEAIGGKAADFRDFASEMFFGPRFSMRHFTVYFAGGEVHAIPIKSQESPQGVDEKGLFTFRGKQFRVKDKALPGGQVQHWAFNP